MTNQEGVRGFGVRGGRFSVPGSWFLVRGQRVILGVPGCLLVGGTPLRGGQRELLAGLRHLFPLARTS